jgi:hypothetical protein
MLNNITDKIRWASVLWGIVLIIMILTGNLVLPNAIKNTVSPMESSYYWIGMLITALLSGYASYLTEIYLIANYYYVHKKRLKFLWLILGILFLGFGVIAIINSALSNIVVNIFYNFLCGALIALTIPSLLGWLIASRPRLPKKHN